MTYQFLNRSVADGAGNTLFSAWFMDPAVGTWQYIATWKYQGVRAMTNGYSFIENFDPTKGHLTRAAFYGNQWAADAQGNWTELLVGKVTSDPTGKTLQRRDFMGKVADPQGGARQFVMQNGGLFFDGSATTGGTGKFYTRQTSGQGAPNIQFNTLPMQ